MLKAVIALHAEYTTTLCLKVLLKERFEFDRELTARPIRVRFTRLLSASAVSRGLRATIGLSSFDDMEIEYWSYCRLLTT